MTAGLAAWDGFSDSTLKTIQFSIPCPWAIGFLFNFQDWRGSNKPIISAYKHWKRWHFRVGHANNFWDPRMLLIWIICPVKGWEKPRGGTLHRLWTAKQILIIQQNWKYSFPFYFPYILISSFRWHFIFPSTLLSIASFPFVLTIFLPWLKYCFQTSNWNDFLFLQPISWTDTIKRIFTIHWIWYFWVSGCSLRSAFPLVVLRAGEAAGEVLQGPWHLAGRDARAPGIRCPQGGSHPKAAHVPHGIFWLVLHFQHWWSAGRPGVLRWI